MEPTKLLNIVLLASFLLTPLMSVLSKELNAIYDRNDGGVTLIHGSENESMAGINVSSGGELKLEGQLRLPFLQGVDLCGLCVVNDQAPRFDEWGTLIGISFDEQLVGKVLPTGLDQQTLRDDLKLKYVTLAAPTTDRFGKFFVIPEPATSGQVASMLVVVCLKSHRNRNRNDAQISQAA